jgi:hypothetical protein
MTRGYGLPRDHSPRVRWCLHKGCSNAAKILQRSGVCDDMQKTHNCCTEHDADD